MPQDSQTLLDSFLNSLRTNATRVAYRSDLAHFSRHLDLTTRFGPSPIEEFAALPGSAIQAELLDYKCSMATSGVVTSTLNRRLAAVRGLLSFANKEGLAGVGGRAIIRNERSSATPSSPGLSAKNIRLLFALPERSTVRGLRDAALMRLTFENALRPHEICALTVRDFCPQERFIRLRTEDGAERLGAVSDRCANTLLEYLSRAGIPLTSDGPLFRNFDHRPVYKSAGLTGKGLRYILSGYGKQLGLEVTPRNLRRSAINLASTATGKAIGPTQASLDDPDDSIGRQPSPSKPRNSDGNQAEVTQVLSNLVSDPDLLWRDAEKLRERSARIKEHSHAVAERSDWLQRKSAELRQRLEEQAIRWSRFADREAHGKIRPSSSQAARPEVWGLVAADDFHADSTAVRSNEDP